MLGGLARKQGRPLIREWVAQSGWRSDLHMDRGLETATLLDLIEPAVLPPLGLVLVPRTVDE